MLCRPLSVGGSAGRSDARPRLNVERRRMRRRDAAAFVPVAPNRAVCFRGDLLHCVVRSATGAGRRDSGGVQLADLFWRPAARAARSRRRPRGRCASRDNRGVDGAVPGAVVRRRREADAGADAVARPGPRSTLRMTTARPFRCRPTALVGAVSSYVLLRSHKTWRLKSARPLYPCRLRMPLSSCGSLRGPQAARTCPAGRKRR